MANPKAPGGTHALKETYATQIAAIARLDSNIYNDFSEDGIKNEVTGLIKIPTRNGEVTVSAYDINNGIKLTQSATDYIEMPMNKHYGVNELIDGYEADAVPDDLVAQRIESAGYSLGIKHEQDAIATIKAGGTTSTNTAKITKSNAYETIATEVKNMKARGMSVAKMRIAVSADVELALLTDDKFANTAGTLGAELVREGVIGKINGVAVKPNYLMGDEVDFIVYDTRFTQKYETWEVAPSVNPLADGKHIGSSALQGRSVGGLIVTNSLGVQIKLNTATSGASVNEANSDKNAKS